MALQWRNLKFSYIRRTKVLDKKPGIGVQWILGAKNRASGFREKWILPIETRNEDRKQFIYFNAFIGI